MHRRELVLLDQVLAQQDRVLEVVALPGDEGDEDVLPQRQLAVIHGLTVGDDLPLLHGVALGDQRTLMDHRALVGAAEFDEVVDAHVALLGANLDAFGVHPAHLPRLRSHDAGSRVLGDAVFYTGPHDGGLG